MTEVNKPSRHYAKLNWEVSWWIRLLGWFLKSPPRADNPSKGTLEAFEMPASDHGQRTGLRSIPSNAKPSAACFSRCR